MDVGLEKEAKFAITLKQRLKVVRQVRNPRCVHAGNIWLTRGTRFVVRVCTGGIPDYKNASGVRKHCLFKTQITSAVYMSLSPSKDVSKIVFADNSIVYFSRLWGLVIRCSCRRFKQSACCRHSTNCANLNTVRAVNNITKICFVDNATLSLSRLWGATIRCTCKRFKQMRNCKHREMAIDMAEKDPNHADFRTTRPGYQYVS